MHKADSSPHSPDKSTCQLVIRLGLGVGGLLGTLCAPALTKLAEGSELVDASSLPAERVLDLGLEPKTSSTPSIKSADTLLDSDTATVELAELFSDSSTTSASDRIRSERNSVNTSKRLLGTPFSGSVAVPTFSRQNAATPDELSEPSPEAAARPSSVDPLPGIGLNSQILTSRVIDKAILGTALGPRHSLNQRSETISSSNVSSSNAIEAKRINAEGDVDVEMQRPTSNGWQSEVEARIIALAERSEISRNAEKENSDAIVSSADSQDERSPSQLPLAAIAETPASDAQANSLQTSSFVKDDDEEEEEDDSTQEEADSGDELGELRLQEVQTRGDDELGILRLLQTAQAPPSPPEPPIAFLAGRLGYFNTSNAFRSSPNQLNDEISQSGLTLFFFPRLSKDTNLYAIAETQLARYERFNSVSYNELEFQLGIRQRLLPRTYAQIGWRNQNLYKPGYRDRFFSVNYIDALVSHRSILNSKTWLDSFYQARLGFADLERASRFRQTFTLSLNYGVTKDLRTSLLYQLDFDDYTQVSRYDTYQQVLGIVSYNITPESRVSVFGGTRFGRSSNATVNLDDTFYGAGLNVSVPLF